MIDLNVIRDFAISAHGDQRYGMFAYSEHLDDVVRTLQKYGVYNNKPLLAAGYLHDIIEDTHITYETLVGIVGVRIADIVYLVTDKHGKNRAERHMNTYPELAKDTDAVILKLADRISNVKKSIGTPYHMKMYVKEYQYFRTTLYKEDFIAPNMWKDLDIFMGRI